MGTQINNKNHRKVLIGETVDRRLNRPLAHPSMTQLKIFEAACAAVVLGLQPDVEFEGSRQQVESLGEVIEASRELFEALRSDCSLREVAQLIRQKHIAAEKYREFHGRMWHL